MSKHTNPYRPGKEYHGIFGMIQHAQVVTRSQVIAHVRKELKLNETQANAAVTVVLSPRAEGESRGDCRGNFSAQGHLYYMEKLPRHEKDGKNEPQKFRLRWREPALEPHRRPAKTAKVEQKKTPAKVTKRAKAKSRKKATAKA